ncbi:L-beta-lysine 5,6-aminomutase beta subunit [Halanaerobium saccharolyticum subsp. saccharolyticum DSM 6643]|uniref:L-beta-lysine 5,6-aminomutase beta subunit n=1 Tax=Halanaerobium saccharolyticum subsp. saccharolyticum DSM 6643 TaxID=1293054 RepID=M5EAT8_9FIRM|nr:L-beta-lysine 5,6-aminomutase beta subunit [Halanaerobium saccharolyticum subsp. saccharolyticum DSM 6643]
MELDMKKIKPYGDTLNDGKVQMSFTLPIPASDEAKEAAKRLAEKMGMTDVEIPHMKDLHNFSYFVIYGSLEHTVNVEEIDIPKVNEEVMDYYEINDFIEENIGRNIVVVGACTGTDAHTVGLDAIMNMKGYAGEYGLERYPKIDAYNLGSQVPNEELIAKAIELDADAILVSQVVTQKNVHIKNMTELIELIEAENLRDKMIIAAGGPRIDHELATELGFDAGFGQGSLSPDVATFLAKRIAKSV